MANPTAAGRLILVERVQDIGRALKARTEDAGIISGEPEVTARLLSLGVPVESIYQSGDSANIQCMIDARGGGHESLGLAMRKMHPGLTGLFPPLLAAQHSFFEKHVVARRLILDHPGVGFRCFNQYSKLPGVTGVFREDDTLLTAIFAEQHKRDASASLFIVESSANNTLQFVSNPSKNFLSTLFTECKSRWRSHKFANPKVGARRGVVVGSGYLTLEIAAAAVGIEWRQYVSYWAISIHRLMTHLLRTHRAKIDSLTTEICALWRPQFVFEGCDLWLLAEPTITRFIRNYVTLLLLEERRAVREIKRQGCDIVFGANFNSPDQAGFASAALGLGIPVVSMQHSIYGCWSWSMTKWKDSAQSNFKLVGGELVARFISEHEGVGCRPIVTGIPAMAALARPRCSKPSTPRLQRPIILYPLPSILKNNIYFDHSRLLGCEALEVSRRIIDSLTKLDEIDVVVRAHPAKAQQQNFSALTEYKKTHNWDRVYFESTRSGQDSIDNADAIVIDSPSSILAISLLRRKPMFVYGGIFQFTDQAIALLQKCSYFSSDLDAFCEQLVSASRVWQSLPTDSDEFLSAYINPSSNDALASAAAALSNIACGRLR